MLSSQQIGFANLLLLKLPKLLRCLGFEAVSRGADEVILLEQNKQTVDNLKENAGMLATDEQQVVVERRDALAWLASAISINPNTTLFFWLRGL